MSTRHTSVRLTNARCRIGRVMTAATCLMFLAMFSAWTGQAIAAEPDPRADRQPDGAAGRPGLRLVQQSPNCADFDVIPAGWQQPAFRLLLPEQISAEGSQPLNVGGTHCIAGEWHATPAGIAGVYRVGEALEVSVELEGRESVVDIRMTIRNLTDDVLRNVRVFFCSGVDHLPGTPGWSNRMFIPPDVPLDRSAQGRYWFEQLTPRRLRALRPQGWTTMHPSPEAPSRDPGPVYNFAPSVTDDTVACAVQSLDGAWLLYQAWDRPGQHATPCRGNACMHLHPLAAESIEPGATAVLRGRSGLFQGDWDSLRDAIGALWKADR